MFDEPTSYLDIKQRIKMALSIRDMVKDDNYVIVVEHDLSILDFTSDHVCSLYGSPTHYGVVTFPSSTAEGKTLVQMIFFILNLLILGINHFLDGFIPSENLRFRDTSLSFKSNDNVDLVDDSERLFQFKYPAIKKTFQNFCLEIDEGSFRDSEINILLGQNGCGKTTFIRMLAGNLEPDDNRKT